MKVLTAGNSDPAGPPIHQNNTWLIAVDTEGVERLIQRMAQHTEQGGIVIFTAHQSISAPSDRIRRIALCGERAEP